MSVINEIAEKVKPGETVYYMDKNNKLDAKTVTDLNNEFEKIIKNKSNWVKILEAIYKVNGVNYLVTKHSSDRDGMYTVVDSKEKTSFDVKISIKDSAFIVENLMDKGKTTTIETADVMDSTNDTPTADSQVQRLIKNLKDYTNKSPKELKAYLESIVKTK
jgi:hypothetical protein